MSGLRMTTFAAVLLAAGLVLAVLMVQLGVGAYLAPCASLRMPSVKTISTQGVSADFSVREAPDIAVLDDEHARPEH